MVYSVIFVVKIIILRFIDSKSIDFMVGLDDFRGLFQS